ncbi:MAG: xanthan lyase [Muribaculaceae bacterium]|nr:xanthan lyase [Muribaculaceae bacterium]
MNKTGASIIFSLILAIMSPAGAYSNPAAASQRTAAVTKLLRSHLPGTTGFGAVSAEKVSVNEKTKTISVKCNANTAYIPFTYESLRQLKNEVLEAMGPQYKKYKVELTTTVNKESVSLDKLVLSAPKKNIGPTETMPFITRHGAIEAPKGLDGSNIALWQSHGWYFEPKLNRWEWQRARIFETVEDLYTQSYVMPFLMPMLENAGAYVMSPRERDVNLNELIIDNDGSAFTSGDYAETGKSNAWSDAKPSGFRYYAEELRDTENPFRMGTARQARLSGQKEKTTAAATWSADLPEDGEYAVYVSYVSVPESTEEAEYTVNAANGAHRFTVNQTMGGGTWIYLGHFPFKGGRQNGPIVELSNAGENMNSVITADAVKIGGGFGNVGRIVKEPLDSIDYEYVRSGYPRFVEGARYFLQWAGAPDSVFTPSNNVKDYNDDYMSRGLWVNWLTGGSSMLPGREGLGIPVDLSFAFHSDAGTTMNDSIIGTLGIYCTAGETLGNGSSRLASRDLTDLVMTEITEDVRAAYEPNWTRRGMWDKSYHEARSPQVPSMLLELLSHQNFADMGYGLDPTFRFTVARAIYKGMLRFLANRDGREYIVQPLPVNTFAIREGNEAGSYILSWQPTEDEQEETAMPTSYIIEERIGNERGFRRVATVEEPEWTTSVSDDAIHSYRIIAANAGGASFPSEVLALRNGGANAPKALIVNGFTRVSAPDRFDAGEIAGFYDMRDRGVAYIQDISYIGDQFEFRRNIPWMDDDAAGFGASRADFEDKVIAGNTFDFTAIHGEALAACGYSFMSAGVDAFTAGVATGGRDVMVDLILGKQKEIQRGRGAYGTVYKAFPSELQTRIADHTAAGGSIFVSGAYVATDIWDNPYSDEATAEADKAFARDVLGFNWRVGQASVTGEAYQVPTRYKALGKGVYRFSNERNPEIYAVESPDSFYPSDDKKGATFMRYTENNLIAGTAYSPGDYRAIVIGFPFETIDGADSRTHLMRQITNFLSGK